jgi:hypothetical protein
MWVYSPTTQSLSDWLTVFGGNGVYISYDRKQELAGQLAYGAAVPEPQPSNWIYASVPFGAWHHIVWAVNGTSAKMYVDGALGQSVWYPIVTPTPSPNWIGSTVNMKFNPRSSAMTGIKVKNCYWFNSQLAAADVTTLYGGGTGTSAG